MIRDEPHVGPVHGSVHVRLDVNSPVLVLGDLDDRPAVAHAEAKESLMIVGDEVFLLGLVGLIQLAVEAVRADGVVLRTGREGMTAYITMLGMGNGHGCSNLKMMENHPWWVLQQDHTSSSSSAVSSFSSRLSLEKVKMPGSG